MRKIFWFISLSALLAFTACSNYTEELWINNDGSGSAEVTRDMGELLPLLQLALLSGGDKDMQDTSGMKPMDMAKSVAQSLLEKGKIDTTIVVADLFKTMAKSGNGDKFSLPAMRNQLEQAGDLSANEKSYLGQVLDEVMTMKIRFQMDTEKDLLRLTTKQSFTNVEKRIAGSMGSMLDMVEKLAPKEEKDNQYLQEAQKLKDSAPKYVFSDKSFSIRRKGMDLSEGGAQMEQGTQMAKGFIADTKYRMIIHLPGKVKSVSVPGATIQKNTVTWEVPLTDLIDPDKSLDIDIDYKGKRKYRNIAPAW